MTKLKRIGVLTSGGDCGGLNAVIRAIFLRAKKKNKTNKRMKAKAKLVLK